MTITCPSCGARYRINDSKIKGRGAKITCPSCQHRFVVYRDKTSDVPENVATLDFRTLELTWKVRKGVGVTYDFHDLATLQAFMQDGQVDRWDQITFDGRNWETIDGIQSLDAHFWDVWQRARRGEIITSYEDEEEDDEDEADAPTTIIGRGSALATEIQNALMDASTPRPVERAEAEEGHLMENTEPDALSDLGGNEVTVDAEDVEPIEASVEEEVEDRQPGAAPIPTPTVIEEEGNNTLIIVGGVIFLLLIVIAAVFFSGALG